MCWLVLLSEIPHSLVRAVHEMFSSVPNNQQTAGKVAHVFMQRALVGSQQQPVANPGAPVCLLETSAAHWEFLRCSTG